MSVTLAEAAARHIVKITADAPPGICGVRLEVLGGGCAGYQYKFGFANVIDATDDVVVERDGAKLIVDRTSLGMLEGSEIDYGESLMESGFKVVNPKAASSCGCGTSFAIKE